MKKIISVVLAVVMLFAVCVPAFAAGTQEINKDTPVPVGNKQEATADVFTKTTKDGKDAYTYSVTMPAEIAIEWGDTNAYDASYTVTSQLLLGAKLVVGVAANNSGQMTNPGTDKFLNFTLSNGGNTEFAEINNAAAPTAAPSVAVANFAGVPIAQYTGTLTYTVTYVAPVATP